MPLEPIKTGDKANFKLSEDFEVTLRRFVDASTGKVGYSVFVSGAVVDQADGAVIHSFSGEDMSMRLTAIQGRNIIQLIGAAEAEVKVLLGL